MNIFIFGKISMIFHEVLCCEKKKEGREASFILSFIFV